LKKIKKSDLNQKKSDLNFKKSVFFFYFFKSRFLPTLHPTNKVKAINACVRKNQSNLLEVTRN